MADVVRSMHPLRPGPRTMASDTIPHFAVLAKDSAWLVTGLLLSVGGGAPSLCLAYLWPEVLSLPSLQLAAVLAAMDVLFCISASLMLLVGVHFGEQRYGKRTQPYPGPFVESAGHVPPFLVTPYVGGVVLTGIVVPIAAIAYLTYQGQPTLGFCTLGLYVLQLFAQIRAETVFLEKESIMWPQVPQVYQTYRLYQLMRGCALTRALKGPEWLWGIQGLLLLLWYFNFAAVTTWMPWLYRWQLQPEDNGVRFRKAKKSS